VVPMAFLRGTEPAVGCGPRRQGVPGSDAPPGAAPGLPPAPGAPQSFVPTPAHTPDAALSSSTPPAPAAALPKDTLEIPSVSAPVTHGAPTLFPSKPQGP
jgi:hypothetical protein